MPYTTSEESLCHLLKHPDPERVGKIVTKTISVRFFILVVKIPLYFGRLLIDFSFCYQRDNLAYKYILNLVNGNQECASIMVPVLLHFFILMLE
jgi:hypothetical protein